MRRISRRTGEYSTNLNDQSEPCDLIGCAPGDYVNGTSMSNNRSRKETRLVRFREAVTGFVNRVSEKFGEIFLSWGLISWEDPPKNP